MLRIVVKGQILADFVVEFTEGTFEKEEVVIGILIISTTVVPSWKVYTDGAFNWKWAVIGIVLVSLEKLIVRKSLRLGFLTTNNETEYEALLVGA